MVLQTNNSKFLVIIILFLIGVFSYALFAQEKGEAKSKLDQLKGKIEKITVKVDGKDVVFEGEDAKKMADKLRAEKRIKVFTSGDLKDIEEGEGNVVVFRSKGKRDGNFEVKTGDVSKKVKVENKDGKKVITVTTSKDGKEETKTYEGEAAEKFLKDEKDAKQITVTVNDDEDMPQNHMMYFNKRMNKGMGMRGCNCCCGEGNGMAKMKHMSMPGKGMKKMIIKEEKEDDDKEAVEKKVEKKIEKKK